MQSGILTPADLEKRELKENLNHYIKGMQLRELKVLVATAKALANN